MFNVLISSLLIYNTKDDLTNLNDFYKLEKINSIIKLISINSNATRSTNEKELRNEGPDLIFMIKDHITKNTAISESECLNQFLTLENVDEKQTMSNIYYKSTNLLDDKLKRNEIRKNMLKLFKSFKCYHLPEPIKEEEEDYNLLDQIKLDDLSSRFTLKLDKICNDLRTMLIKPKCLNEINLNGFKLAEYMKLIVNLINNKEVICLHNNLFGAVKRESNYVLNDLNQFYTLKMNEFIVNMSKLDDLEKFDHEITKKCILKLHKILAFDISLLNYYKQKFYKHRNSTYLNIINNNFN